VKFLRQGFQKLESEKDRHTETDTTADIYILWLNASLVNQATAEDVTVEG